MQDAYSLRCSPQVHGAARDTVDHAALGRRRASWPPPSTTRWCSTDGRVESNGNFHGAPVAYVLDFLAIVAADVASITERRTDRFLDQARSHGLPPFLAHDPGVDSGHMIAQYTQAAIVSELKRLAEPGQRRLDPVLSAMQEDHVSMGWSAARKLRRSVDGLARVVAIEFLTAARALDLRGPAARRRRPPARRSRCCAATSRGPGPDRHLAPEIEHAVRRRTQRRPGARRRGHDRRAGMSRDHREPSAPPRGPELTAKSWQTEAPLRMLMNNLDPENAERPEDLVVYGGTGKAARSWEAYDAIVRTLTHAGGRRDAARAERQAGRRDAHPRVGAAGADRELQPGRRLGQLGGVPAARGPRADDVRPDDRRLVDLHRHPGHPAGHLRDVRRGRRQAVSAARWPGTITLTAGLGGMGGAQPLAVTMNDGVVICIECDDVPHQAAHRAPLPRRAGRLPRRTRVELAVEARDARRPLSIGVLGNAAEMVPALLEQERADRHRHRPDLRARPAVLPAGRRRLRGLGRRCGQGPGRAHRAGAGVDGRARARRWWGSRTAAPRCSTTATRSATRPARAATTGPSTFPGFVPAYIRPLFCEGKGPFRWAALSGDPADIAATDRAILELFPDNERLRKWITMAGERVQFQGLPARICWLGYGERHLAGLRFNEMVASGELNGADRDRPRPPRQRVGRLAVPRDRGDARRLRRDRRLAAAQRAGQHRLRRDLGVDPPRRRRRHGPVHPRRPGHRRRRHRRSRRRRSSGC